MKHILTTFALAAILFALPNRSNAQVYIDISGGQSMLSDWDGTLSVSGNYGDLGSLDGTWEFEDGEAFNFEIGKKNGNRSLGLLIGYTSNEVDRVDFGSNGILQGDAEITSMPLLGVFGFGAQITDNLSLNLGLGAGVSFVKNETTAEEQDDIVLQFQAKAGLELLLTENISLGLDYRFSALTSPEFKQSLGNDFWGGDVEATLEGDMVFGHFIGLSVNIAFE
jgi:opacity protein-like surface antigen